MSCPDSEAHAARPRKRRAPFTHKRPDPAYLQGLGLIDERGAVAKVGSVWLSIRPRLKPVSRIGRIPLWRIADIDRFVSGDGAVP